jgi:hypothetical protein
VLGSLLKFLQQDSFCDLGSNLRTLFHRVNN